MSKQKECPSCGLNVDKKDRICHYCGYEFPETAPGKKIAAIILIFLLLIWFLSGIFF